MRLVTNIPVSEVLPSSDVILRALGVPSERAVSVRLRDLMAESVAQYQDLAKPVGMLMEVSQAEFDQVYFGEGKNAEDAPLGKILATAHRFALFAVTVGEEVCQEITRHFDEGDPVMGALLDTLASESTELAATNLHDLYLRHQMSCGCVSPSDGVMRFSPGYCGWHLSSQRKLFELLQPGEIGIELLQSYLMRPLKSISGVLIAGPKQIFACEGSYSFCRTCSSHSCKEQVQAVTKQ